AHCLQGVENEVQDDLLKLDPITGDYRQAFCELDFHRDPVLQCFSSDRFSSKPPNDEARESLCYAVWLFAGPAGQIAVRLLALRIGPPVVMLDARCPRRRDASRAKHECRDQRGGEITNHAKLLIVSVSAHTVAGASAVARRRTGWSPGLAGLQQ